MLVAKSNNNQVTPGNNLSMKKVFYQGMITNILNPKVALFFLAFLPQFVEPSGNMNLQMLILGIIFNINGAVVNFIVAVFASRAGSVLRSRLRDSKIIRWISASVFIGLGLRLALSGRK
jgi:threonine/homoserine/homoserine lactone efflux protein